GALARGDAATALTRDVLPPYLANQRWFAAKGQTIRSTALADLATLPTGGGPAAHVDLAAPLVDVEVADPAAPGGVTTQRYFVPTALVWDEALVSPGAPLLPFTLAKIRRGSRLGALVDAAAIDETARAIVDDMGRSRTVDTLNGGRLQFRPGGGLAELAIGAEDEVRRMGVEQSNTSILVGDKAVLKLYRKLSSGIHPELEIGRFLTDVAHYPNVPPLLGTLEHVDAAGTPTALAVLQGFVRNQGDGWSFTQDYLARELDELRLGIGDGEMPIEERHASYIQRATTLGTRVAELHRALALTTGDPAFDPEPLATGDLADLTGQVVDQAAVAFGALARAADGVPDEHQRAEVRALIDRRGEVEALIQQLAAGGVDAAKTRHHGDLHLGQVLVTQADFTIVDFEGEPQRSLDERRAKKTPLRDVAGMLRSFDYAAWACVMHLAEDHPDWMEPMLADALQWRDLAGAAFMTAYAETAEGCASWPADRAAADRMIDLLQLEKALYEIGYEAANRPGWLIIPVRGVARILDAHAAKEDTADGE
ncbi:MAG: alpha-amylase, partial [Alphaproteobacteria bacterium]|nr:alpha-amylase [Alphaproteobacteria bacterium]